MTVERTIDTQADRQRTLVEVAGVSKTFGGGTGAIEALVDVSLAVSAGEFFTLLGPSGCGKTTLLRLLAGFEQQDGGAILIDGRSVDADPPNKRPVNMVFQSYALFPHMSVAANVAFGLQNRGVRGAALKARVADALRLVQLEAMADRRPTALSGGQQQRVALARALAPEPRLLLLDEPLSALDPKLRRGMQVELKRIQRETGITFCLVTHDQEEALSLSDRVAVMDGGRIRQIGKPADVYERPRSRFVADFLGANVLPGELVGMASPFVAIRPERIGIVKRLEARTLPGRLASLTYLGARTACTVVLDGGIVLQAECEDLPPALSTGEAVHCRLPTTALVALDNPS